MSDIPSSYDLVARAYRDKFVDELDRKPRDRELLTAFAASTPGTIVDVGCGPGQVGAFVRRSDRTVVGLDLSPVMAGLAIERLDGAVVGDMRALPFATDSVGGFVAFYSVIHLHRADVPVLFSELRRALLPGGRALIAVHEGDGDGLVTEFLGETVHVTVTMFQLDELVDAATAAGFDVTDAIRRPPYPDEGTTRLYLEVLNPGNLPDSTAPLGW